MPMRVSISASRHAQAARHLQRNEKSHSLFRQTLNLVARSLEALQHLYHTLNLQLVRVYALKMRICFLLNVWSKQRALLLTLQLRSITNRSSLSRAACRTGPWSTNPNFSRIALRRRRTSRRPDAPQESWATSTS